MLGPGEGVKDGAGGIAQIFFEGRATRGEPVPVEGGLEDSSGVVIGDGKDDQRVARADRGINKGKDGAPGDARATEVTGQLLDSGDHRRARIGEEPPAAQEVTVMTVEGRRWLTGRGGR